MTVRELLAQLPYLRRNAEVLAFKAGCEEFCERELDDYQRTSGGVRDVNHKVRRRLRVRGGSGYLPSSTTEGPGGGVRVRRVWMPDSGAASWTVLGHDHVPVEPVERWLA